ncbi:RNA-binding domain-containing protein [Kineococcus arenarius]|uniref:RNA-binding domain-containing protein n=1 Tax=Kineococcus sp. SYSU DK007 TaxID=3383128 RepID=UPI003D7CF353
MPSPPGDLPDLLDRLIAAWESEVVEFKEASAAYSTSDIGRYFSALANEANLHGADAAWLVFGVQNRSRRVVGTDYRPEPERLQNLKMQIAQGADPQSTFREIHELDHVDGRVVLFEIPPAPRGIPIGWQGHYYARAGESLTSLPLDKQDAIRGQTIQQDWTAAVVPGATLDDLDPVAVQLAREAFARKYANRIPEGDVISWPVGTFTDRAKLTQEGRITRTALLLLGRAESAWKLSPHPAQLTWSLVGPERAYEHFGPPFLLSTTRLFRQIRNIQLRLLPQDALLPQEVSKYDQQTVLEALHNCIAHQDYSRGARVVVTEQPDRLVLRNAGSFFEGSPDDYAQGTRVPLGYRNPFLVQAMVELNMIDTMGYGIRRMNDRQAKRYLPLPDYDLSDPGAVVLTLYGGVVDPAYTRLLMQRTDLPLTDVLALDRIQKSLPVPDDVLRRLRRAGLVEGRRPHLRVAAAIAATTASRVDYIRTRAQDDTHYSRLVTDYLDRFGSATRQDLDLLLRDKLSDALSDEQKVSKISNLLTKMRRQGEIRNAGSRTKPRWVRDV